jgi:hypothetical protein
MDGYGYRRRLRRLLLTARQVGSGPVSHGDEQRGDVFAVLVGFLEGGASARRGDAFAAQPDRHLVRLRVGALDAPLGVRLVQADVVDHLSLLVIEAAQKRARSQQAAKAAIRKSRKCVCK